MNSARAGGTGDANAGIEQALELLKQALAILDKCGAPPELGARLHEIIATAQAII